MRISFLLAALLCGLVSLCVASDQPRQISSSRFDSVSGIVHPADLALAGSDRADAVRPDQARDGDVTCSTVQS